MFYLSRIPTPPSATEVEHADSRACGRRLAGALLRQYWKRINERGGVISPRNSAHKPFRTSFAISEVGTNSEYVRVHTIGEFVHLRIQEIKLDGISDEFAPFMGQSLGFPAEDLPNRYMCQLMAKKRAGHLPAPWQAPWPAVRGRVDYDHRGSQIDITVAHHPFNGFLFLRTGEGQGESRLKLEADSPERGERIVQGVACSTRSASSVYATSDICYLPNPAETTRKSAKPPRKASAEPRLSFAFSCASRRTFSTAAST